MLRLTKLGNRRRSKSNASDFSFVEFLQTVMRPIFSSSLTLLERLLSIFSLKIAITVSFATSVSSPLNLKPLCALCSIVKYRRRNFFERARCNTTTWC